MNFPDDALLPENQQPLVIQVAPYGPEFLPEDSTDIPVTTTTFGNEARTTSATAKMAYAPMIDAETPSRAAMRSPTRPPTMAPTDMAARRIP